MSTRLTTASPVPAAALPAARADAVTVDALQVGSGGGGLLLGRDAEDSDRAVTLSLFRPEPTQVVAVAPVSLTQVLLVRSLALGARVVVETARPTVWTTLAQLATRAPGAVIVTAAAGHQAPGSLAHPVLLVVDDEGAPPDAHRVGPWSAQVTVVEGASRWNAAGLGSADVVLAQGLGLGPARTVGRAMGLADPEAALAGLPAEVVTLLSRAGTRTARVVPTSVERWLLASSAAARR